MFVKIFTDGAARGNPEGPGGYGTVLQYVDSKSQLHEREFSAGYKKTTKPCEVEIISDSKYVTDAFNQHWIEGWLKRGWKNSAKQEVKNIDLWQRLLRAKQAHKVTFTWVKGHAGHPENERCDMLATAAADCPDKDSLLEDVVGEIVL